MAKITVSFVTNQDDKSLKIESDSERNKDYAGSLKTKFLYGDTAYFRVYSAAPDKLAVCATDGEISDLGFFYETTAEIVTFITEQTAATEKPVAKLVSCQWLGNSLGDISLKDSFTISAEAAPDPLAGSIAMASVAYQTVYRLYGIKLSDRDMDEYPITVYVGSDNA